MTQKKKLDIALENEDCPRKRALLEMALILWPKYEDCMAVAASVLPEERHFFKDSLDDFRGEASKEYFKYCWIKSWGMSWGGRKLENENALFIALDRALNEVNRVYEKRK